MYALVRKVDVVFLVVEKRQEKKDIWNPYLVYHVYDIIYNHQ